MIVIGAVLLGIGAGAAVYALARTAAAVAGSPPAAAPAQPRPSLAYRAVEPVLHAGASLARRLSPRGRVELIRRRIAYAGLERTLTPERALAYKALGALGGAVLGLSAAPGSVPPPVWAAIVGAVGAFVPDLWLDGRAKRRQAEIARDLPEALDLMAITVEAGLGLEQAMQTVGHNLTGPLGEEIVRTLREMELGVTRRDALNNLRARTDVPELSAFVVTLIQADQVGAPISEVLRVQAAQVRLKRRQRAQERAAKTPVKILFPVVFFIFPALFVIVIGPGAIRIFEALLSR